MTEHDTSPSPSGAYGPERERAKEYVAEHLAQLDPGVVDAGMSLLQHIAEIPLEPLRQKIEGSGGDDPLYEGNRLVWVLAQAYAEDAKHLRGLLEELNTRNESQDGDIA